MSRRETVLVLDGQTNQALACVRSLGRAGFRVLVASHRRGSLAAWSRFCRGALLLDGQTLPAFAQLREWAVRQGVRLVLPVTERSCWLCNVDRAAWEASGILLGCGPQEMLMPAFDKERTLRVAAECGLAVPPNRSPQSLEAYHAAATELGYPCVIKPRFSNPWDGSGFLPDRGVAYVAGPETLSQAVEARRQGPHWPLIQKYVTGRGIGLFALCDRGRPLVWFAHERLRDVRPSGSGSSLRRSVPVDSHLREAAERLLGGLEWHGPAMLEFRHDGARPWLMEMNGRFWGSLQLAVSAGVDFPALWVRLLLGESVAGPAVTRYRDGVAVRWLWGDVKRFFHILRGPPRGFPGEFPSRGQGFRELFGRQPTGTQLESWDRTDPWPAVGEWVQGLAELITWKRHHPALGKAS